MDARRQQVSNKTDSIRAILLKNEVYNTLKDDWKSLLEGNLASILLKQLNYFFVADF